MLKCFNNLSDGETSLQFEEMLAVFPKQSIFNDMESSHHYQFTSTCVLTLHLPRGYDADHFGSFILKTPSGVSHALENVRPDQIIVQLNVIMEVCDFFWQQCDNTSKLRMNDYYMYLHS